MHRKSKLARRMRLLRNLLRPSLLIRHARRVTYPFYIDARFANEKIETRPVEHVFGFKKDIELRAFGTRDGNVSYFELLTIAAAVRHVDPRNLLEIGTFDGNTTLQMALNSHPAAIIHTLDLPPGANETALPVHELDWKYIRDEGKTKRKYVGSEVEGKVRQHFGDSTRFDFEIFCEHGPVDFCFIDGGHTYECVKSDTQNAMKVMAPEGIILWHDFDPGCVGVYEFICELSQTRSLTHLEGTRLVALLPKAVPGSLRTRPEPQACSAAL